jgi:hypothetical protein
VNQPDDLPEAAPRDAAAPLPNRFTRSTLGGCLGILCVLALPLLLYIPVERLGVPLWLDRLIPLVGVAALACGVWLIARVPGGAPRPEGTPARPLTSTGRAPVRERPATAANRAGALVSLGLAAGCAAGYFLVEFAPGGRNLLLGTLLTGAAGAGLLVYAGLAAGRVVAHPAWRWVRTPLGGGPGYQVVPPAVVGITALAWALIIATGAGYAWAPLGVGLLLLGSALGGALWQRLLRNARDGQESR